MADFPTALTNAVDGSTDVLAKHINNLEAKVGIDSSAVTTSHDYKLSGVTGTDKAVSKTGTETLTNKTLTAPTLTTPSIQTTTPSTIDFVVDAATDFQISANTLTVSAGSKVTSNGAVDITIANTVNDVGLTVAQNDTTNNPVAASITNAGTGDGLLLDQNGGGIALDIDSEATAVPAIAIDIPVADTKESFRIRHGGADKFMIIRTDATNGGDVVLRLGNYFLWVDATGDLRIHNAAPTADLDGTVVGSQS